MELRLLSTDAERRAFARRLVEARITRGAGFVETNRSLMGEVHVQFGRLYALFDEQGPAPSEMMAGFVAHDLATFSQSYPKPDLSHLPPERVLECGELWATTAGAARLARHAGWILAGLEQAEALLVYPIVKPWNLSCAYKQFARIGEPIEWPYARTVDGGKISVQPMVLQGEALNRTIEEASSHGYSVLDGERGIRFDSPYPVCTRPIYSRRHREDAWAQAQAAPGVTLAA
jgi:hypothetical protein